VVLGVLFLRQGEAVSVSYYSRGPPLKRDVMRKSFSFFVCLASPFFFCCAGFGMSFSHSGNGCADDFLSCAGRAGAVLEPPFLFFLMLLIFAFLLRFFLSCCSDGLPTNPAGSLSYVLLSLFSGGCLYSLFILSFFFLVLPPRPPLCTSAHFSSSF